MIRALRLRRRLVAPLLAATLGLSVGLTSTPASAQNEPPPAEGEGDKSGRPLDGYLATGCMVGLALFLIAKTARRTVAR
jgi:hypothetical protein